MAMAEFFIKGKASDKEWEIVTKYEWPLYRCSCGVSVRSDVKFRRIFCPECREPILREDLKDHDRT